MYNPRTMLIPFLFCSLLSLPAGAQSTPPQTNLTRLRGTVTYIAPNHRCFTLADRSGNQINVVVDSATHFIFGRDDGTFLDVVQIGDDVRANVNSAGIAVDVTSRNNANRPSSAQLKELLGISDDDCLVLVPLIAKVQNLQQEAQGGGRSSDVRNARDALRQLLRDPNASQQDISTSIRALRDARTTASRQLAKAQQDLISVLTVRQEAILIQMGILP
ncbi:MAG TPA: hypothetical protein VM008_15510 [Phycisphaerae bacterium]|nr:hypothetical protein [Phycisphaerae bacterium]